LDTGIPWQMTALQSNSSSANRRAAGVLAQM